MSFWDTSALLGLFVDEVGTEVLKPLAAGESDRCVWWGTRAECVSGICLMEREGILVQGAPAREALARLSRAWTEVQPSEELRTEADLLLARHPFRAADAFQLAAAMAYREGSEQPTAFVALDRRLRGAALKEGFRILP